MDDSERCRYYLLMQEATAKFDCRIHAFCCMTNHIHMALQVGVIPLSRIMQNISLRYTTWINRKHGRTGHLFQGRFKALLIDADSYLSELVRYIHLNPVRAGMVSQPIDYIWSSHAAYLGEDSLPWLTTDWILSQYSSEISAAQKQYYEFVQSGMLESRRLEFHSGLLEGRILGDECFAEDALKKANQQRVHKISMYDIVSAVSIYFGISIDELAAIGKTRQYSEARSVAALLVRESPCHSLSELGALINRDITSLSQAARRYADKMVNNPSMAKSIQNIKADLNMDES